ncbi:hypothetical protein, partial [Leclercia adecarboxylata]|uniref:hypothetical protein n=1 Tax=Leclercia adecarboxylata TaxID=83655 RepID=UPI00234C3C97
MVHEDCLLKKLLSNSSWKQKFYAVTFKDEQGIERVTWEGKYKSLENIARIKKFYESHPQLGLTAFYRNLYNINKTDVNPIIRQHEAIYVRILDKNFLRFLRNDKLVTEHCNITVGYDASVTQRSHRSRTSILVEAQVSSGLKFVLEYKYGQFDVHDRYK